MEDDAVRCDDVTLARGGRAILTDVSFSIPQGAFVGLFGPNGAGKTTLLRALLGLEALVHGNITVMGATPRASIGQIGYMPQSRSANGASLTGWDLLASGVSGTRWGIPRLTCEDRLAIQEALDAVDDASGHAAAWLAVRRGTSAATDRAGAYRLAFAASVG